MCRFAGDIGGERKPGWAAKIGLFCAISACGDPNFCSKLSYNGASGGDMRLPTAILLCVDSIVDEVRLMSAIDVDVWIEVVN